MQLIGVNQFGVTVYLIKEGEYYCTAYIDNSTFIEATLKAKKPENITIQMVLINQEKKT